MLKHLISDREAVGSISSTPVQWHLSMGGGVGDRSPTNLNLCVHFFCKIMNSFKLSSFRLIGVRCLLRHSKASAVWLLTRFSESDLCGSQQSAKNVQAYTRSRKRNLPTTQCYNAIITASNTDFVTLLFRVKASRMYVVNIKTITPKYTKMCNFEIKLP